jgi:hypothetical protein
MFSMLCIAALLQCFSTDGTGGPDHSLKTEYLNMKEAFREKAVQCLVLARYTTGGPYILETLITILAGEFVLLKDGATDSWLSIGLILQIAVRMGYHRDPDHFSGLSPFESEMRRRIWTAILQLDLITSLEAGLPRNATDAHIDTKPPSNLLDSDFDQDTTEMPPSRPETEWTPILPLITRRRLIFTLGKICDFNSDIKAPSHVEVAQVDAVLQDVYKHAIPPVLRWSTLLHPITDSPSVVAQRVSLETTYHKSRILLYRRALVNYPARPPLCRDRESVRICLESALKILSFQETLHEESQPLGRLYALRWKVNHILNMDVLLATSILCLYLQDIDRFNVPTTTLQQTSLPTAEGIRQKLTLSHKIWREASSASVEAGKVAKALSIVLGMSEVSADHGNPQNEADLAAMFDAMPSDDTSGTYNQCKDLRELWGSVN